MQNNDQKNYKFSDEQINNFAGLGNTLKKIHLRLTNEGYKIDQSGHKIIPPQTSYITSGAVSGAIGSY